MKDFIIRRAPRYPVCLKVININGLHEKESALLDISAMGALMEAPYPLELDKVLQVTFQVPDGGQFSFQGQVEWVRSAFHKSGYYLMGLSFTEPNWDFDRLGQELFFS